MSGSSETFEDRLKAVRSEGKQIKDKLLEERMPTPEGLSIEEITRAERDVVRHLEEIIAEGMHNLPNCETGAVSLTLPLQALPLLCQFGTRNNPEWWLRLCSWSHTYGRRCFDDEAEARYKKHVESCIEAVKNMWNRAHPTIPVRRMRHDNAIYSLEFDFCNI